MGDVLPLVRKEAVDAAWARFQSQAIRLTENQRLYTDRSFMEELARREREWKRLFWAGEGR